MVDLLAILDNHVSELSTTFKIPIGEFGLLIMIFID